MVVSLSLFYTSLIEHMRERLNKFNSVQEQCVCPSLYMHVHVRTVYRHALCASLTAWECMNVTVPEGWRQHYGNWDVLDTHTHTRPCSSILVRPLPCYIHSLLFTTTHQNYFTFTPQKCNHSEGLKVIQRHLHTDVYTDIQKLSVHIHLKWFRFQSNRTKV